MKLTLKQIRSITLGAVRITECDGKISFFRFTEEQQEIYRTRSEDFYKKSFSTAGVRLECLTDSRSLALSVEVSSGSSRRFFAHEIVVNGVCVGTLGSETTNTGSFSGRFDLGEGEKHLTIYLPWSTASVLRSLELDDGAIIKPIVKPHKMILYGDSITQGYDARRPSRAYAVRLADALDAEAVNKAIGGEIFYAPHAYAAEDAEPDYVTVAYGTNDFSRASVEDFEHHATEFYQTIAKKYPTAKIFAITPIWRADYEKKTQFNSFFTVRDTIARIVQPLDNVTLIDGFDFVPKDPSYFSDLYLHPNDEGFDYYADALIEAIKSHL